MATFVILLDEAEFFFQREGFTIVLKLFRGMLINIKAGSRNINHK